MKPLWQPKHRAPAVAYRRYAAAAPHSRETHLDRRRRPDRRRAGDAAARRIPGRAGGHVPGAGQDHQRPDAAAGCVAGLQERRRGRRGDVDGNRRHAIKPSSSPAPTTCPWRSAASRRWSATSRSTPPACGQTMDLQLTLLPRTPRSAGAAANQAGRGRGGAANGTQPFEAIAVQQQAAGALVAETAADREAEESAARQLLPPGFSSDAPSQAVTFTGNSASLDRGMLGDRFEAIGRGEFGAGDRRTAARFRHPRSSWRTARRIRAGRVRRARRSRRAGRTGRTWRSRRPRWSRRPRRTWRARRPRRFRHRRTRRTAERLQRHGELHLRRIGARRGPVSAAPRLGCRARALQPAELRRHGRRTGQDSRRLRRHAQDELHGQLQRQPRRRALRSVRHRADRGDARRRLLSRVGPADRSAHRAAVRRQPDPAGRAEPDVARAAPLHSVAEPSGGDAELPLHDDDRLDRRQRQRPRHAQLHAGRRPGAAAAGAAGSAADAADRGAAAGAASRARS